jgi:hypothetical protein
MTIFNHYFKTKFLIGGGFVIIVTSIRYYRGYDISLLFALTFIFFILALVFILGLMDYNFYEKISPKIVMNLLNKSPLLDFQRNGFKQQEENKIEGEINNFKIILSPLPNIQRDNYLTILIPLELKEGLDKYFKGVDENFKLSFTGKVLFAEAVLKNYDKNYDYNKLLDLINKTTLNLQGKNMERIKLIEE